MNIIKKIKIIDIKDSNEFEDRKIEIKKFWLFLVIPLLLLVLLIWGPSLLIRLQILKMIYFNDYVAVYTTDNQTLYGRFLGVSNQAFKLADVYYFQYLTVGDKTTGNLVKRGQNEITSPDGTVFINPSQILYWEKIGKDSKVMKLIKGSNQ
jgi:hypothetical protein